VKGLGSHAGPIQLDNRRLLSTKYLIEEKHQASRHEAHRPHDLQTPMAMAAATDENRAGAG